MMNQQAANVVVATALGDSNVAALHASIQARSPITIQPSTDKTWGNSTKASGTTISVVPTAYPAESLYHELLHADLKLNGYRQHLTFLSVSDDRTPFALAQVLDKELQHHRMFAAFVAAAFDPVRFYHDGDDQTFAAVRAELKRMNPGKTAAAAYFVKYLSIIAPGGAGGEDKRAQLDRFFRIEVPSDKVAKVDDAAAKVRAWGSATSLDPGPIIIAIIAALGDFDGWWIGTSQNFPSDGHFMGAGFTKADAKR